MKKNSCEDVYCRSNDFCYNGACIDKCTFLKCAVNSTCIDGFCVDIPVKNPNDCPDVPCATGYYCFSGAYCLPNEPEETDGGTKKEIDDGRCSTNK